MYTLRHKLALCNGRYIQNSIIHSSSSSSSSSKAIITAKRTFHVDQLVELRNKTVNWMENVLLSAPKGFGKYYPKGGNTSTGGSSSSSGASGAGDKAKKASGGGNSGGGNKNNSSNGNKPDFPNSPTNIGMLLLSIAAFGYMVRPDSKNGKEISWKDFQTQLLQSGQVDSIVIANKSVAKVVLRKHVDVITNGQASATVIEKQDQFSSPSEIPYQGNNNASAAMNKSSSADGNVWNDDGGAFNGNTDGNTGNNGGNGGAAGYRARLNQPNRGFASPYYFNIGSVEMLEKKLEDAQLSLGISPKDFVPVLYVDETNVLYELLRFLPNLLLIGAYFALMRGSGGMGGGGGGGSSIFNIGKSKAKMINKEIINVTFADVAGCNEAKKEIMEFVEFLKNPKKFTDLGAKIPKGALICGPPGTGKTLLAKATAGEASVPFFSLAGSDFVEMFVGVGASRVRDLFKQARANAPCIIFIDEIDAVGRKRSKGGFNTGNDERESTLNQLLVEMDGFDPNASIVVLAGTNRADVLDDALTRPGRFDRKITVDKPDIAGRKAIFDVHLRGITLDGENDRYSGRLAALTPGFSGADIANICNEAAIMAARKDKKKVDITDFEAATDRVIGGMESHKIMSPEERRVVAYHEAGHAIAGWNLEHADPLLKVTIVPRDSGALGFAQYLPKEIFLRTREQILDMVCMALAGRASEQITFGRVTTGAADDLRRVTQIVYQMVQVYGMCDKVGQMSFPREEGSFGGNDRLYSEATAEVIDAEVRAIIDEAYDRTVKLMTEKKEQIRIVAELLLEKETISNIDIGKLIGKRPFSAGAAYDQYVDNAWESEKAMTDAAPADDLTTKDANAAADGLTATVA